MPSGGNPQPWHVWALGGHELAHFKALIAERIKINPMREQPEYNIYSPELKEPYRSRRFKNGRCLSYHRNSAPRQSCAFRPACKEFHLFGAPVGLFLAIDSQMEPGQWADLGMYMQSIMLLAWENGLSTCPQEAWALWHKTGAEFIGLPSHLMLFCGMALGYVDRERPINRLRADRADPSEFATIRRF
ncbi:nitroreductase family protein [Bradyrhizobium diazoefficiens]|nr:nitroreductase family protein [Bradyrhizobium diazoefficiens]QQO23541.1 nitroreductase family protein [Bradyrhizobium diazoefficiens]